MRHGIMSAGNWLVDVIKFIDTYPAKGNLTTIRSQKEALGGCSHNVLVDIARLESGIPLYAGGVVGDDRYGRMCLDAAAACGIDSRHIRVIKGVDTSYTDVMTEREGGARTFFHCRGANARLCAEDILAMDTPARIFHLGYLLLLDGLDAPDAEYGVAAARALDGLSKMGYKTSIDVVSEQGERYRTVVLPCLKYTDYLIVNEVEAGQCLGRDLRGADGSIDPQVAALAARDLLKAGVREMVVIHFPEGGVAASVDGGTAYADSFSPGREEIVATVGAGDAFCAGSLYAIHEGYGLHDMLRFASACARYNLFSADSTSGAPTLNTLKSFLETSSR